MSVGNLWPNTIVPDSADQTAKVLSWPQIEIAATLQVQHKPRDISLQWVDLLSIRTAWMETEMVWPVSGELLLHAYTAKRLPPSVAPRPAKQAVRVVTLARVVAPIQLQRVATKITTAAS